MTDTVDTGRLEGRAWLDRTIELTSLVAGYRGQGETSYRMAPEVRDAVGNAGLFRLTLPVDPLAPVIPLGEFVQVHEELAFADPSVAWASANSNGAASLLARLPREVIPDVADQRTRFIGVGLPPTGRADVVADGFRVSGRWPVVSGSLDADWFMLQSVVHEGGVPRSTGALTEARFVPVPADAVVIEDTWRDVMAVKGSGSNAVRVQDVFVPEARSVKMFGPAASDHPIDRLASVSRIALQSLELAAIAVGIGRSAVAAATEQAGKRVSVVNQAGWVEWPSVQNTMAAADMAVEASRAALFSLATQAALELKAGSLSPPTQARLHSIADHAMRAMRHAVSDLFTIGSVDALRMGHGLERALRDVHGFSVQWERYRRLHYAAGRVLLGAPANDPLF